MSEAMPSGRTAQRLGVVILDELRERLLGGLYPVGSRISIEEVKAEFGVSKQPVMDAVRRLEATRRSDSQLAELDDAWQRIADLDELDDHQERSRKYRGLNRAYHRVIHRMS